MIRIATPYGTVDELLTSFHRFCEPHRCFVPSQQHRPIGLHAAFALLLRDGKTVVLKGRCIVEAVFAAGDAEAPLGRAGLRLGIRSLARDSAAVYARLLARRAETSVAAEAPETIADDATTPNVYEPAFSATPTLASFPIERAPVGAAAPVELVAAEMANPIERVPIGAADPIEQVPISAADPIERDADADAIAPHTGLQRPRTTLAALARRTILGVAPMRPPAAPVTPLLIRSALTQLPIYHSFVARALHALLSRLRALAARFRLRPSARRRATSTARPRSQPASTA